MISLDLAWTNKATPTEQKEASCNKGNQNKLFFRADAAR